VAFIGCNFPGPITNNDLKVIQKQACSLPITPIFKTLNIYNYITNAAFGLTYNYGNVFACELVNVLLPEMKTARDSLMRAPNDVWTLLTV
jgi:hypothetical protein